MLRTSSFCIFRARNFVQCTRRLTFCPFGNETNLHVLLSACISVERSAEPRFPSGLPAVGAAPRHFPVIVHNWRMQYGTWHLMLPAAFETEFTLWATWTALTSIIFLYAERKTDRQTDRWVYYDDILWIRNAHGAPLTTYELLYYRFI